MTQTAVRNVLHVLYRFYDADDGLLYVGITKNPPARFSQHANQKAWWQSVARIDLEHHRSRTDLEDAEREAIRDESPRYNVASQTRTPVSQWEEEVLPGFWTFNMYSIGLHDGGCVRGVVMDGDHSGLLLHCKGDREMWVPAEDIGRAVVAPYEGNEYRWFDEDALVEFEASWQGIAA